MGVFYCGHVSSVYYVASGWVWLGRKTEYTLDTNTNFQQKKNKLSDTINLCRILIIKRLE